MPKRRLRCESNISSYFPAGRHTCPTGIRSFRASPHRPFGLTYNALTVNDTRSELGARFDDLTMLGAMPLVLRARLAWSHDWVSNPSLGAGFQTLAGASL